MDWRDDAACQSADPCLFDDIEHPGPALAYCRRCDVTAACLQWIRGEYRRGVHGYSGIAGGVVFRGGQRVDEREAVA